MTITADHPFQMTVKLNHKIHNFELSENLG